jgi:hypothetical protein
VLHPSFNSSDHNNSPFQEEAATRSRNGLRVPDADFLPGIPTVPVPAWAKRAVDTSTNAIDIHSVARTGRKGSDADHIGSDRRERKGAVEGKNVFPMSASSERAVQLVPFSSSKRKFRLSSERVFVDVLK